jgi:hypothetical protein
VTYEELPEQVPDQLHGPDAVHQHEVAGRVFAAPTQIYVRLYRYVFCTKFMGKVVRNKIIGIIFR